MKFQRMIFILIIATIAIAYFTNPKESDFNVFIQPQITGLLSAPLIEYKSKLIYSNATITFFNPVSESGKQIASANRAEYIGIFGRFWKLEQ